MLDESIDLVNYFLSTNIEEEEFKTEKINGLRLGLKVKDDCYLPNYVRNLSIVKTLDLRSDDTFVIGYPKSGIQIITLFNPLNTKTTFF